MPWHAYKARQYQCERRFVVRRRRTERVIAALAAAPQVSRSEVEGAAQELELSRAIVYRLVAR
jgi:hypothetical protein